MWRHFRDMNFRIILTFCGSWLADNAHPRYEILAIEHYLLGKM